MHPHLELAKHRLTEERAANALQLVAEEEQALVVARRVLHHVVHQQVFVRLRGDLGHENRIARHRIRLRVVRHEAVDGVSVLMRQRRNRAVFAVVVQQQIRVLVVDRAVHVGAAALAGTRKPVDPALLEAALHHLDILIAQDLPGGER